MTTVLEGILPGPRRVRGIRVNVLLRKAIFPSQLKVTCCSLSRNRAALPLNGTRSLGGLKRRSAKVKVLKLDTSKGKTT